MTRYNNEKNALENMISSDTSYLTYRTKIEKANSLNDQNELRKAFEIYRNILNENPRHTGALFGIGKILEKQQKFDLAIQFLSKAIESDPSKTQVLLTRGRIFRLQDMPEKAISDFTKVISNHPDHYEALIARGVTFGQTRQFNAAIDDFSLAIRINSNCAEAFYNRGVVYEKRHEFLSAIDDYSTAIKLNPVDNKAYNNRGVARRETMCFDAALEDFEKSIEIKPDFAEGYYNKSLTLLSVGNLKEGFKLYEYRWKTAHFRTRARNFSQPLWLGKEDLTGKTILLHSEQGLGDSIQFCRYIKFFEKMDCTVLLEIEKPLMTLMQSLLPKDQIFAKGDRLPDFDFHSPLMSLPFVFKTNIENIPYSMPYLKPDPDRTNWWVNKIKKTHKPVVGISWRGNPDHVNDKFRSMDLAEIISFLSSDFDWVSLEKYPTLEEKKILRSACHVRHFGNQIGDFSETASLCQSLDAVVSVDTSAAHLAASIGTETHILLRKCADWRWLQGRKDTPWYKAVTIHRKSEKQSWPIVLSAAQSCIAASRKTYT